MNDNDFQKCQKAAANYMAAIAHVLGGRLGRHAEFIQKVELILSGAEPDFMQLMQFTGRVRATRCPVIWLHRAAETPTVPVIGLVAADGKKVHVIENCMLWLSERGSRAQLVPDGFNMGAFRFDDQFRLRRLSRAPARDFDSATVEMVRAYDRLTTIEADQFQRGDEFVLPQLAKAA